MILPPSELEIVKDVLLLKFLMEHGGEMAMSYEDLIRWGSEYDGWKVMLLGNQESFIVRVRTQEGVR